MSEHRAKDGFSHLPPEDIPPEAQKQLEEYRRELDQFDNDLADAIGNRFKVVRKIGDLKAKHGIPAISPVRAQAVIDRAAARGPENGLSPDFMRSLYEAIIDYAHDLEKDIRSDEEDGKS